jgi:hypothetical protein
MLVASRRKGRSAVKTTPGRGMRMAMHTIMWIEAILTQDDFLDILSKLSPLEIRLGDSGVLNLSAPTAVTMVVDQGVAVVCDAALHFPVLGIAVPVHMRGLTVELRPTVRDLPGGGGHEQALALTLQIDRTGVSHLPQFFDERVTKMVNEELAKNHIELAWNFHTTLSHSIPVPAALASISSMGLVVTGGRVKVTENTLSFAVCFDSEVQKRAAAA